MRRAAIRSETCRRSCNSEQLRAGAKDLDHSLCAQPSGNSDTAAASGAAAGLVASQGGLTPTDFSLNPSMAGTGPVVANDSQVFQNEAVSGGANYLAAIQA